MIKLLRKKGKAVCCTSTPRKARTHYDRQRPLEQSNDNNNNNEEKINAEDSQVETPVTTIPLPNRRQSRRLSQLHFADGSSERRRKSQHFKNKRYKRTSFYLPGNMFAHARTISHAQERDMKRLKAQDQRRARFNMQREILSSASPAEKLITTQDLLTFDKNMKKEMLCDKDENDNLEADWVDIEEGNSAEFKRLLHDTQSQAPFEVQKIQFSGISATNSSNSHSSVSTISNALSLMTECDGDAGKATMNTQISAATQLSHVTSTGSAQLSRTIYGGSVIFNRRIPNVSSTHVRKSSIYIKNKDASDLGVDDIILVTDQTITIADLARMWKQMNKSTRVTISAVLFASLSGLFILITNIIK